MVAQSYAPEPGEAGSTAIHKDSSIIDAWANACVVERGYLNIDSTHLGFVDFGEAANAVGPADGTIEGTVSLGDGGIATLNFYPPIENGPGPDFAVFENGFADHYMELAFVEVSSDGLHFVRFPAYSETPTDQQLSNASYSDCRFVHNLAGKYRLGYGTPFDLEDLVDSSGIDLSSIKHVRMVDCVGKVEGSNGTFDVIGRRINDPFPTPFSSGGFDLDAVGVMNVGMVGIEDIRQQLLKVNNPFQTELRLRSELYTSFEIHNMMGQKIAHGVFQDENVLLATESWPIGMYVLTIQSAEKTQSIRIMKH